MTLVKKIKNKKENANKIINESRIFEKIKHDNLVEYLSQMMKNYQFVQLCHYINVI